MRTPYDHVLKSLTRREFLNVAFKLGSGSVLLAQSSKKLWAKPVFNTYPFTLGVASGDPSPDGFVLWTRLAPRPLEGGGMPMVAVEVQWEVASDDQMLTHVQSGTAIAYAELGHALHVEVEALQPSRDYWYRFVVNGVRSPVGRSKTTPAEHAAVQELRIGVCGCNHYEQGYFTAYKKMAEEQFDAIFHTGDYIYEYAPYDGISSQVREHTDQETFSLQDYRNRYALYKLDPDLQAVHASSPFIASWDDHEIDNDWAAEFSETNTPPDVFRLRRAAQRIRTTATSWINGRGTPLPGQGLRKQYLPLIPTLSYSLVIFIAIGPPMFHKTWWMQTDLPLPLNLPPPPSPQVAMVARLLPIGMPCAHRIPMFTITVTGAVIFPVLSHLINGRPTS